MSDSSSEDDTFNLEAFSAFDLKKFAENVKKSACQSDNGNMLNQAFQFATTRETHSEFITAGLHKDLIKMLEDHLDLPAEIEENAYGILGKLSDPEIYTPELVEAGAVPLAIKYVFNGKHDATRHWVIVCLFHISESVFIRDSIPKYLNENYPDRINEFILFGKDTDASGIEMWTELLKNTDLVKDQYKPGKAWYDPKTFPVCKLLEDNYELIKKEAIAVREEAMVAWPEKFLCQDGWNVLGMYAFCNRLEGPCKSCPNTSAILAKIPGLQTAIFSCLNPRCHIKPHIGYYQYSEKILRVHMGIVVPEGCVLRVNGEGRNWDEGKCLVFDDTFRHEAWNPSYNTTRIVLMLDIEFQGNVSDRNPEFYEKSKKQQELYGSEALISADLLQALSAMCETPTNCKERPVKYA